MSKQTTALFILDGFGYSETSQSNAIEKANSPTWDRLWSTYPRSLIKTSGLAVGLPDGQMGNSEVGHMNLGAGRIVYQNFTRVSKAIVDGDFFENPALTDAVDAAVTEDKAVHILGLLSPGGVHSHEDHIPSGEAVTINDGDAVVFMNFRPDRARELSRALVQDDLDSTLDRSVRPKLSAFVTLTEYASDLPAICAYPPEDLNNTLGEIVARADKTQLRIAETEKYAHVTFFFNGGIEAEFPGEKRILIPSPDVATYDLQPEMNAPELTDNLVEAIESGEFDLIICNYANGDMVGHTGNLEAAIKAVEALDTCLQRVTDALLKVNGQCLITADHGNCELMIDPETGGAVTSHTNGPVPLVLVSNDGSRKLSDGRLCDIAPTLLAMMDMEQPEDMSGESLLG